MSRYPRYPYQNTLTSTSTHATTLATSCNNNTQQHHAHHQQNHHHQLRNPWIGSQQACESQSGTNSSSSSRTYRGAGWQHHAQPDHTAAAAQFSRPLYHDHVGVMVDGPGRHGNTLLVQSGCAAPTIVRYSTSSRGGTSDHERPTTPASSPGGSAGRAAVDGCGGHCVAFETFCYYCLQVIFIAGILTGVSLVIAGSVLRSQQRGGDLLVLVYIGVLVALVCTLLLSVQCCVRRNVKRRKRSLRSQRDRVGQRRLAQPIADIPMQELKVLQAPNAVRVDMNSRGIAQQQYQPLLMHIVQQQQQTSNTTIAMDSLPRQAHYHHHPANLRSGNTTDTSGFVGRMMDVSRSGTPWWRRTAEMGPPVAESRH